MGRSGMFLDDSLVVSETAVFRELDGETVILNLETGNYFGLDDVGTRIWTLLREHGSLQAVLGIMLTEYDVTEPAMTADLLGLASELSTHGLVSTAPIGPSS